MTIWKVWTYIVLCFTDKNVLALSIDSEAAVFPQTVPANEVKLNVTFFSCSASQYLLGCQLFRNWWLEIVTRVTMLPFPLSLVTKPIIDDKFGIIKTRFFSSVIHYTKCHMDHVRARSSLLVGTHYLSHLSLDKMATISQTTVSNVFSWMKRFLFWF